MCFDALYVGWKHRPIYRFGISPNKLFEYMMAGVPVVHAVEAANDPVQDAGCGVSVAPEDKDALCKGILSLLAMPEDDRKAMGERGRKYVLEHHSVPRLAKRFLAAAMG